MNTLARSDAFFLITALAVGVISILLIIAIIYLIRLFRDVKYITGKAKQETDLIAGDIEALRKNAKIQSFKWAAIIGFLKKLFKKGKRS
ncbi:MAG: hypothetical protein AAB410_05155 [Patescibacteria group bacterium]